VRQRFTAVLHGLADREASGLRPARAVVICGFPRSGSTLLQLMLETSYPDSRHFGRERSALDVAHAIPGRYSLIISKRPNDVFWLDEIRDAYSRRARQPCFILTTRDPRAIMTSKHAGRADGYYVDVARWRSMFEHIRYARRASDVTVVDYAELVQSPAAVLQRLAAAIGEEPARPLDPSSAAVPEGFSTTALNGVRPIDTESLRKWRSAEHVDRIRQILAEVPEFPQLLIEEGYEPDTAWADAYR
jgi:hypothetical protein